MMGRLAASNPINSDRIKVRFLAVLTNPTGSPVSPMAIARDRRFFFVHNCDAQFVPPGTFCISGCKTMLLNKAVPQSV